MSSIYPTAKRLLDVVASGVGLVCLAPALAACALAVKVGSPGPVFFLHERVGQRGRRFRLVKFRSMTHGAAGAQVTAASDLRITPVGRLLRKYKLDELPQLWNVFVGEMSLVGPRPEVARYVELFRADYERILTVRPGITDFAAIEYRHEEELLAASADPERAYVTEVLPAKIALYNRYLDTMSLSTDLRLIAETLRAVVK